MAEQEYTPTEADQQRAREALAGLLVEDIETDGPVTTYNTGPAGEDEDAVRSLAEQFAEVRADERAKALDDHKCYEQAERAYRRAVTAEQALRDERAKRIDMARLPERAQGLKWNRTVVKTEHGALVIYHGLQTILHLRPSDVDVLLEYVGLALEPEAREVTDAGIEAARAVITALAPYNMELKPDGSEDRQAAAYVSGVQAASDAIPEALRAAAAVTDG